MKFMQFDFGENWKNYSISALDQAKIAEAKADFKLLTSDISLESKTFLDIGFGQGLSLLNAVSLGAIGFGNDINIKCNEILQKNKKFYPDLNNTNIPVIIGSVLDKTIITGLSSLSPDKSFDVVHSWGVLHHTGNMYQAIENAITLVKENGYFILAIYNRHWSGGIWLFIKWLFNKSPRFIKWCMVQFFCLVIAAAKFMTTGKNPFRQERGMSFYHDVIDWVGGYPYEYASAGTIINFVSDKGFTLEKFYKAKVPTGCNEFVFKMRKKP